MQDIGSGLITDLPTFEVELGSGMRMIMSCSTVLPEITKMPVVIEQWKIEMFNWLVDVYVSLRCVIRVLPEGSGFGGDTNAVHYT